MGSTDWQINKPQTECIKYLLDNQINCDINFKIGKNQENFKAHKLILGMRSPVFDRMFNGRFEESKNDPIISDVTAPTFEALLRYCYYECLDIEDDVALDVLYAAQKYMLPLLEDAARRKLIEILSEINVWEIYNYAGNVGDSKLLEGCKRYFEGDVIPVTKALQSEGFLNLPHDVLLDFLHINDKVDETLSLHDNSGTEDDDDEMENYVKYKNNAGISISEIGLFKASNAWAQAECLRQEIDPTGANKRIVLGRCLFLIRFPTMLLKDLMTVVHPTGILTQAEIVNLCQFKNQDSGSECPVNFPSKEHQFVVTAPRVIKNLARRSAVFLDTDVRLTLSRLWVVTPGSFKITVKDEKSDSSFSMKCDAKHENHRTTRIPYDKQHVLYMLDVKPQILEARTRYSISTERIVASAPADPKQITKWVEVGDLAPFSEVKITNETNVNSIYAISLCLV